MKVRELAAVLAAMPEEFQDLDVVTEEEGTQRYLGSVCLVPCDWKHDGTFVIDLSG